VEVEDRFGLDAKAKQPAASPSEKPAGKAGKNTGLPQKNSFFCEKTALMFFFVFFALFARAMCGAGKSVWVIFCVFNGKFRQYFLEFPPLSSSVPKVLGP
jgi:hypothetical protein